MRDGTLCLLVRGKPPEQVLLGLKKAGFGAGKWGGFGGKMEPGETALMTAVREVQEESGIQVAVADLARVGHLTFVFPFKPEWSQVVHVFLSSRWHGKPAESEEMIPLWFAVDEIPYHDMWQDCRHWLPRVLVGERVRARFGFAADNHTVDAVEIERW
jgi:8-oxo-dGTP diphosphatase